MNNFSFRRSIQTQLIFVSILSLIALAFTMQVFWTIRQRDGLVSEGRARSLTLIGTVNNTIEAVRPLINSLEDISELNGYLSGLLEQNDELDFLAVIWRDGTVVFHSDATLQGQRIAEFSGLPLESSPRLLVPGFGNVYVTTSLYQSRELVGPEEFEIVVGVPVEPIDARLRDAIAASVLITIFSVVVTGGLLVAILRTRVTGPLAELTQTTQDIRQGDLGLRVGLTREDEIGQLGSSFNAMADRLSDLIDGLETRVAERTRDLEAASAVARQITTTLALDELLQQVVVLVTEQFSLYATSVFLLEESESVLDDRAGVVQNNGAIEALKLGPIQLSEEVSVVAAAARQREPVLLNAVQSASDYRHHESLPLTRAEFAIPLVLGNNLLGVFDVQAADVDHFDSAIQQTMVTLAEQVAIAVRNAQLFAEATAARAEAEDANRMKSHFLASMSHELRTPMNAILNFTEFVAIGDLGPVNDEQVAMLHQVIDSAEHLMSLINDILDMTKIEVGMMEILVEPFSLDRVLATVLSTAEVLLQEKGQVALVKDIEADLPALQGDRRRIRQVLLNLLSNAIKFTESGTVTLGAHRHPLGVHLFVADTGPGIEPESFDLIFQSFRQTRTGLAAGSGTGLGLSICKYLVEAHGGRIWVESKVGQGAVFNVLLPAEAHPDSSIQQVEAALSRKEEA